MCVLAFAAVRWLQNQIYSNETVSHTKQAEDTQLCCLDFPRLTSCFLLFVAQLDPSLPFITRRLPHDFSLPALARCPAHRFYRPPEHLFFLFSGFCFFGALCCCIRVEFPELRAPPSRLSIFGSEAISRPQRLVRTLIFKSPIGL